MKTPFYALAFTLGAGLALGPTLAGCGGGGDNLVESVQGTWEVKNDQGRRTGQVTTITEDHIVMTNPLGSASEGDATFSQDGDQLSVRWMATNYTLELINDGEELRLNQDGTDISYHLVPPAEEAADGGADEPDDEAESDY